GCKETVENQAPNAVANGPATADAGDWVQLDGSGSSDPDGDALNMRWSFVQLPLGSGAVLNDPTVENPSFLADVAGDYEVRLVVDDGFLRSDPASVSLTADPVNGRPTADAGLDRGVVTGNDVLLDGADSSDPDDDTLTYSWSFVARPTGSNAAFDDATAAAPTFTADLDGDYRIHLVVSDAELDSPPDEVVVNAAADNLAPVADAGVDQSVAVGLTVDLDGSGSYDPNGSALTYTWTFTERPLGSTSTFTQDGTATATFLADVEGTFVVALVVDDGSVSSAPDALQIQAFIENTPPVADAGIDITNAERGEAVHLDGSQSSDTDIDDLLSFTWTSPGPSSSVPPEARRP
ncbi:MAG: PKD domain-containing protein, partial [Deltaproteobacteria bacterium]|nr:PKD domain-containing protein [Deltaproteobacteria bacterium]